jgi:YHS domain-containing protein
LVSLRNLPQHVDLYEIVLLSCPHEYAIDPVCKMQVDTRRAAGDLHFHNKMYWFCSLSCVERLLNSLSCMHNRHECTLRRCPNSHNRDASPAALTAVPLGAG